MKIKNSNQCFNLSLSDLGKVKELMVVSQTEVNGKRIPADLRKLLFNTALESIGKNLFPVPHVIPLDVIRDKKFFINVFLDGSAEIICRVALDLDWRDLLPDILIKDPFFTDDFLRFTLEELENDALGEEDGLINDVWCDGVPVEFDEEDELEAVSYLLDWLTTAGQIVGGKE